MEWGGKVDSLQRVVDATRGKVIPEPLQNRPVLYPHLGDIMEAMASCTPEPNTGQVPLTEIEAWLRCFSTFDKGARVFIKLFRAAERIRLEAANKKQETQDAE